MKERTRHGMTSRDLDAIWRAVEILEHRTESIKLALGERGRDELSISHVLEALDTMLTADLIPERKNQ